MSSFRSAGVAGAGAPTPSAPSTIRRHMLATRPLAHRFPPAVNPAAALQARRSPVIPGTMGDRSLISIRRIRRCSLRRVALSSDQSRKVKVPPAEFSDRCE